MLLNVNIDINTFLYFVKAGAAYRRQGEGMKRLRRVPAGAIFSSNEGRGRRRRPSLFQLNYLIAQHVYI